MKRILITGEHSYIGSSMERYLCEYNAAQGRECYQVDKISQRDEEWKGRDFAPYDAVLDVTGIAHADIGHVTEEEKALYYQINRDLAVETAKKAREQGVPLFVYLSSIIVYGDSAPVGQRKHITGATKPMPSNFYGDSKLQAELQLRQLEQESFQVAVLRLPFIYGRGSRGNYSLLAKLAGRLPVFPDIRNERSMLYIENLCEFLRLLTESGQGGTFFPQNAAYTTTADMVREIAAARGKKLLTTGILNPFVRLAAKCPGKIGGMANKAFGSLTYDQELSGTFADYCLFDLRASILRTECEGDR